MSTLHPGQSLSYNQSLQLDNSQYRLTVQEEKNVVLYNSQRQPLWATNTAQSQPFFGSADLIMQDDGNLVLYLEAGRASWASNTEGNPGAYLVLQDDGNLGVRDPR